MTDFFVIGPPRSGGTLLYGIVCSDPNINPVLAENHFPYQAALAYAETRNHLQLEQDHFFSGPDDAREFFASWVRAFLDRTRARYAPVVHLAIKSIALGTVCADLGELLPKARFLVSVRDPRDIIASMIVVGEKQDRAGKQNQYPRDIESLAKKVMINYQASVTSTDKAFRRRVYFVKYEELTHNPAPIITALGQWAGLDLGGFDPSRPWPRTLRNFDQDKVDDSFLTREYGAAITSKPVGRYRQVLNSREITVAERIFAPMMQYFRYAPHKDSVGV